MDQCHAGNSEGLQRLCYLADWAVDAEELGALEEVDCAGGDAHSHCVCGVEPSVEVTAEGEHVGGLVRPPCGADAAVSPVLHHQRVVFCTLVTHYVVEGLDPHTSFFYSQEVTRGCEALYVNEEDCRTGEGVFHYSTERGRVH